MANSKHVASKPTPLHVVRSGEVVITLAERQSNSGYRYRDMVLLREWLNQSSGRRAHGASFFEKHEEDLVKAIREAAAWLRGAGQTPIAADANGPLEDYEHESRKMEYESQEGRHSE
jgi:hypothetical protein